MFLIHAIYANVTITAMHAYRFANIFAIIALNFYITIMAFDDLALGPISTRYAVCFVNAIHETAFAMFTAVLCSIFFATISHVMQALITLTFTEFTCLVGCTNIFRA
jgi:hypothetical protein